MNPTPSPVNQKVTIYYKSASLTQYVHYHLLGGSWTVIPGAKMNQSEYAGYSSIEIALGSVAGIEAAFNSGTNVWDNNGNRNYSLSSGIWTIDNGVVSAGVPNLGAASVTIYYKGLQNTFIHFKTNLSSWTAMPGLKMQYLDSVSYYKTIIGLGSATSISEAAFTDGIGSWDNNAGKNYSFTQGNWTLKNGVLTQGIPDVIWTPTPVPTATPILTATPAPTNSAIPTAVPTLTPIPEQTTTPMVTPQVTPTINNSPTPFVTASIVPTNTPSATPTVVTVYYRNPLWNQANIHYSLDGIKWTTSPGVKLSEYGIGYWRATILTTNQGIVRCAFTDNGTHWDNYGGKDYTFQPGTWNVYNGNIQSGAPNLSSTEVTVYYRNTAWTSANIHYTTNGTSWTVSPGLKLTDTGNGYWVGVIETGGNGLVKAAFTDNGTRWDNNTSKNYTVPVGIWTINNGVMSQGSPFFVVNATPSPTSTPIGSATPTPLVTPVPSITPVPTVTPTASPSNTVKIFYRNNAWTQSNIHYSLNGTQWTTMPGVAMADAGNGYWVLTIQSGPSGIAKAAFTDNGTRWDNNNNQNYVIPTGIWTVNNGILSQGEPPSNVVTVYYKNSFPTAYIHYRPIGGVWTMAPGVSMSSSGYTGYSVITVSVGTSSGIESCFNNGSTIWDNNASKNYTFSTGIYTVTGGVIKSGRPY